LKDPCGVKTKTKFFLLKLKLEESRELKLSNRFRHTTIIILSNPLLKLSTKDEFDTACTVPKLAASQMSAITTTLGKVIYMNFSNPLHFCTLFNPLLEKGSNFAITHQTHLEDDEPFDATTCFDCFLSSQHPTCPSLYLSLPNYLWQPVTRNE